MEPRFANLFPMRKPVIAGNWKMYKLLGEAVDTVLALKPLVANANHCEIVIAPVFTAIKTVADRLEGSNIHVAGQNCAVQNDFGAHTGEIAPAMLKDVGCSHVIIGHSERRQFYGETDESVNLKTKAALAAGLTAIVCVGEMLAEREAGNEGAAPLHVSLRSPVPGRGRPGRSGHPRLPAAEHPLRPRDPR